MNNYEILGIPKDSDITVIKKAYRKWAIQLHPDKTNGDPSKAAKFVVIKQAYEDLLLGKTGEPVFQQTYSRPQQPQYSSVKRNGSYRILYEHCKIQEDGSFLFCFSFTDVERVEGREKLKKYYWGAWNPGTSIRRVKIEKELLEECDYVVKLRIKDYYGNYEDKEFKIKKPKLSFKQRIVKFLKSFY